MLSGVNPTLHELKGDPNHVTGDTVGLGIGYYLAQLSYSRWSVNLFWHSHSLEFNPVIFPEVAIEGANHMFDEHGPLICGLSLFLIGLVFRFLAFLMIRNMKVGTSGIFTFSSGVVVNKGQL